MTWLIIVAILLGIITARCFWIWTDGDKERPGDQCALAFVCLLVGAIWPLTWVVRFITCGFANPFKSSD